MEAVQLQPKQHFVKQCDTSEANGLTVVQMLQLRLLE